eukprot:366493-Chlamydomonas_euryale.AAC.6
MSSTAENVQLQQASTLPLRKQPLPSAVGMVRAWVEREGEASGWHAGPGLRGKGRLSFRLARWAVAARKQREGEVLIQAAMLGGRSPEREGRGGFDPCCHAGRSQSGKRGKGRL